LEAEWTCVTTGSPKPHMDMIRWRKLWSTSSGRAVHLPHGGRAVLIWKLNFGFLLLRLRRRERRNSLKCCILLQRKSAPFARWARVESRNAKRGGRQRKTWSEVEQHQARIEHLEARDETRRRFVWKQRLCAKTVAPTNESLDPKLINACAHWSFEWIGFWRSAKENEGCGFRLAEVKA
jgi:hypothetical protein